MLEFAKKQIMRRGEDIVIHVRNDIIIITIHLLYA